MMYAPLDRRLQRAALIGVLIVLAAIVFRASFLRGILFPVRIAGDSMAERLYGEHERIVCPECRFGFPFSAGMAPRGDRVICPNCGAASMTSEARRHPGQRVLLDRWPLRRGTPRRWELVAFATPDQPHHLAVKRVVGLPEEQVSIRYGDVFANGKIVRKSLADLRQMALMVHDARCRPPPTRESPGRWCSESPETGWKYTRDGWSRSPLSAQQTTEDWLVYRHRTCWSGASPHETASPVMDNYGFNQPLSRQLHPVTDLMLACIASCSWQQGQLQFRLHDGYHWFRLQLLPGEGVARLLRDGRCVRQVPLPAAGYARGALFEVAICDRQILFGVDGATILDFACEVSDRRPQPVSNPLAIAADGLDLQLLSLQVLRDIHYLDPNGLGVPWQATAPLQGNQYFVVGDNVPVSRDSRHWPVPGLPSKSLLGRVLDPKWRLEPAARIRSMGNSMSRDCRCSSGMAGGSSPTAIMQREPTR